MKSQIWYNLQIFVILRSKGHLTQEYVLEVPPELIIGLPARVLLSTVDRSEPRVMRLATGLEITEARRPRGQLADKIWGQFKNAQQAYSGVSPGDRPLLEAVLIDP